MDVSMISSLHNIHYANYEAGQESPRFVFISGAYSTGSGSGGATPSVEHRRYSAVGPVSGSLQAVESISFRLAR